MGSQSLYQITPVQIRTPRLTSGQITKWMRLAATRQISRPAPGRAPTDLGLYRDYLGVDFEKAEQALNRAQAKTCVKTIKPFRRLRRNQGAVNQALIDSFGALLEVNKQMKSEIAALSMDIAALRQSLAKNDALPNSTSDNTF